MFAASCGQSKHFEYQGDGMELLKMIIADPLILLGLAVFAWIVLDGLAQIARAVRGIPAPGKSFRTSAFAKRLPSDIG